MSEFENLNEQSEFKTHKINENKYNSFKQEVERISKELDRDGIYAERITKQSTLLKTICEWIERKIFALICVSLAILIIYYSNFFKNLFHNGKVDQFSFYISMTLYIAALGIFTYLCAYLPYYGINEDQWDTHCPNAIPAATLLGVLAMITIIISIYPVWGLLAIPMVIIMKLGLVMSVNFVPCGEVGSLIFILIVVVALTSGFFIEHEGYLH
jgi:hypothetical protein